MNIKIVFASHPQQTMIYNEETGEPYCDALGLVLSATAADPGSIEAKIITDRPIFEGNAAVEGECIARLTEQLVMSDEALKAFAKLVAFELTAELHAAMRTQEDLDRQLLHWFAELDHKEEAFIERVAKRLAQCQQGVIS